MLLVYPEFVSILSTLSHEILTKFIQRSVYPVRIQEKMVVFAVELIYDKEIKKEMTRELV